MQLGETMSDYQTPFVFKDGTPCRVCTSHIAAKQYVSGFSSAVGTVKDWTDQLRELTTTKDCIKWWEEVNNILWLRTEYSELIKLYIRKVAFLSGKEWLAGDKPFPNSIAGIGKIYGSKI